MSFIINKAIVEIAVAISRNIEHGESSVKDYTSTGLQDVIRYSRNGDVVQQAKKELNLRKSPLYEVIYGK